MKREQWAFHQQDYSERHADLFRRVAALTAEEPLFRVLRDRSHPPNTAGRVGADVDEFLEHVGGQRYSLALIGYGTNPLGYVGEDMVVCELRAHCGEGEIIGQVALPFDEENVDRVRNIVDSIYQNSEQRHLHNLSVAEVHHLRPERFDRVNLEIPAGGDRWDEYEVTPAQAILLARTNPRHMYNLSEFEIMLMQPLTYAVGGKEPLITMKDRDSALARDGVKRANFQFFSAEIE